MRSFWAYSPADMLEEDYFYPSDLQETRIELKSYSFNRPWGVPVRYHDFNEYNSKISPDCFEFHLSYSDLDLNIDEFLMGEYKCGFVVHAPELFFWKPFDGFGFS